MHGVGSHFGRFLSWTKLGVYHAQLRDTAEDDLRRFHLLLEMCGDNPYPNDPSLKFVWLVVVLAFRLSLRKSRATSSNSADSELYNR